MTPQIAAWLKLGALLETLGHDLPPTAQREMREALDQLRPGPPTTLDSIPNLPSLNLVHLTIEEPLRPVQTLRVDFEARQDSPGATVRLLDAEGNELTRGWGRVSFSMRDQSPAWLPAALEAE